MPDPLPERAGDTRYGQLDNGMIRFTQQSVPGCRRAGWAARLGTSAAAARACAGAARRRLGSNVVTDLSYSRHILDRISTFRTHGFSPRGHDGRLPGRWCRGRGSAREMLTAATGAALIPSRTQPSTRLPRGRHCSRPIRLDQVEIAARGSTSGVRPPPLGGRFRWAVPRRNLP